MCQRCPSAPHSCSLGETPAPGCLPVLLCVAAWTSYPIPSSLTRRSHLQACFRCNDQRLCLACGIAFQLRLHAFSICSHAICLPNLYRFIFIPRWREVCLIWLIWTRRRSPFRVRHWLLPLQRSYHFNQMVPMTCFHLCIPLDKLQSCLFSHFHKKRDIYICSLEPIYYAIYYRSDRYTCLNHTFLWGFTQHAHCCCAKLVV